MNGKFRKASALLATVALCGGMSTAFALLASPAGAAGPPPAPTLSVVPTSTTSATVAWAGAGTGTPPGYVTVSCSSSIDGAGPFTSAFAGNGTADYYFDGAAGPYAVTGLTASTNNLLTCTAHEFDNVSLLTSATTTMTAYLPPPPPTVTVTVGSPTTTDAKLALVGDGEVGPPATIQAQCSQVGGPTYVGNTGNNTGAAGNSGYDEPSMTTNGQPVICTAYETSNHSVNSAVTTGQVYLPPPAPTIGPVSPAGPTHVSVAFTGNGTNIDHFTATCTSSAGGSQFATGSASPILVGNFTNLVTQVITCSVTETFSAPNSLTGDPSANGSATLAGLAGPGCIPSGTVAAPTQISAAAEAFPGAEVSWAPVDTDCLVGYLVTPSTGSAVLVPGHGTTTLVKGPFAFGSSVTFTVAAVTGSGAGPASTSVTVTIGTPAAASAVKVSRAGKGAIKVAFKAGNNNGARITGFAVTCGPRTVLSKASPTTVTGLASGKSVTCTVRAANSRGTGARSQRSARINP
jgi:hypothetical protein